MKKSKKANYVKYLIHKKSFDPSKIKNKSKNIKKLVKAKQKKDYDALEKEFEELVKKK